MKLYEHASSGNCLKCRLVLRHLSLPYESVSVDLFRGETRTDEHFGRNPDGRIPVLETDDGDMIPESGAILLFLAEGTDLLPPPGIERARVYQWMFFEQNRIEADLSVARFLKLAGRDVTMPEVFANRLERGRDALAALDRGLADGRAVPGRRRLHRGRLRVVRVRALRRRCRRRAAGVLARRRLAGSGRGDARVRQRPRAGAAVDQRAAVVNSDA